MRFETLFKLFDEKRINIDEWSIDCCPPGLQDE